MRALRLVPAVVFLALAWPAAGRPLKAIVWREPAATREAARFDLAAWERAGPSVRKFLRLPEGFPRILQSEAVQGTPPGWHAVVLGFCSAEEADPLVSFLSMVNPAVHGRSVEGPSPACPVIRREWVLHGQVVVEVAAGTLSVTAFTGGKVLAGGDEKPRTHDGFAAAVLRSPAGTVLDQRLAGDEYSSVTELEPADRSKRIRASGTHSFDCWVAEATWTFEAIADRIVIQQHDGKLADDGCPIAP